MTETASTPSSPILESSPTITYEMSATVGKIADALAKAQGVIEPADMAALNPHFGKNYADLADVVKVCQVPLANNNIARPQFPSTDGAKVSVMSMLIHGGSGEWLRCKVTATAKDATPQSVGSAITYLKRYGLAALVGVVARNEDDDGNAGSNPNGGRNDGPPPQQRAASKPAQQSQAAQGSAPVADMPEAVKPFAKRFESIEKGENAKAEFDKVVASSRETFEKGSAEYKAWAKCAVAAQNRLGIAPAKAAQQAAQ